MKTSHTPGLWHLRTIVINEEYTVEKWDSELRSKIAVCRDFNLCHEHGGSIEANARLIAAAPELLACLELIYSNAAESPEWIRSRLAPAIAKAKGEQ